MWCVLFLFSFLKCAVAGEAEMSGFCEAEHLVAVFLAVLAAGDVQPAVLLVVGARGFEYDLVKVGMFAKELYPSVGNVHVGMCPSVLPRGVWCLGQAYVGSLAYGVLAGIDSPHLEVECIAAVARGDDDGLSGKLPQGFEYGAAELL